MTIYKIRAGSTRDWEFTLKQSGAAYSLASATAVKLHRRAIATGAILTSSSGDVSPILIINSPASAGKVTLSPGSTYWVYSDRKYEIWFEVVEGTGSYFFAEDSNVRVEVTQ